MLVYLFFFIFIPFFSLSSISVAALKSNKKALYRHSLRMMCSRVCMSVYDSVRFVCVCFCVWVSVCYVCVCIGCVGIPLLVLMYSCGSCAVCHIHSYCGTISP